MANLDCKTTMTDVGGHRLETLVLGVGEPAVVFEAGFIGRLGLTRPLQERVAEVTRTIAYERAGLGGSDVGPDPRSARQIARELRALLSALNVQGPVVLVGHSAGALYNRVFAHAYPELVAGLIMVDPATATLWEHQMQSDPERWEAQPDYFSNFVKLPPGYLSQYQEIPRSAREARAAWPLPSVPVAIFTAMVPIPGDWGIGSESDMRSWFETHKDLADRIPQAKRIADESRNHTELLDHPQLYESIVEMVETSGQIQTAENQQNRPEADD